MNAVDSLAQALSHRAHLDPALLSEQQLMPLLSERRSALRLDSVEDYAKHALHHKTEFDRLRDLIAVPETWLFRYGASFELLREALRERHCGKFRALSVPCATGAEPLSIAATAMAAGVPADAVKVIAVDSSPDALARARAGRMTRMHAREGVPAWAADWFVEAPDCVDASGTLLDCVEWIEGTAPSVLDDLEPQSFDAIFCRNLAIYLRAGVRRTLGKRLAQLLAPHGLIFLGHAEPPNMFGLADALTAIEPRASFAFARCAVKAKTAASSVGRADGKGEAAPPRKRLRATMRPTGRAAASSERAVERPVERPVERTEMRPPQVSAAHSAHAARAHQDAPADVPSLEVVRAAADAGHLRQALEMGSLRSQAGDRSCDLLLLMGSAHAALGEHAPAERVLRQVVYLEPDHAEALIQLASLAEHRGDHTAAQRYRARAARSTHKGEGTA